MQHFQGKVSFPKTETVKAFEHETNPAVRRAHWLPNG